MYRIQQSDASNTPATGFEEFSWPLSVFLHFVFVGFVLERNKLKYIPNKKLTFEKYV